jgi:glycosyltransferase involved in cell wall biosynthesis
VQDKQAREKEAARFAPAFDMRSLAVSVDPSGTGGMEAAITQDPTSAPWSHLEHALEERRRHAEVWAVMAWIAHVGPLTRPLVSVILPTRDRERYLARAIKSVMAQSYEDWELLVVDDASVDGTSAFLMGLEDPRIRVLRGTGSGVCAARNVALKQARGELVAYLDDDNLMHPEWLKAVVWAFEQRPAVDVLFGAVLIDDALRVDGRGSGGALPVLYFGAYDDAALAQDNVADIGCIAHRSGLAEARFDESLREMGDWDLLFRLTRAGPPLALPVIACFYTTDAPNRLSHGPTYDADEAAVRAKNDRWLASRGDGASE